MSTMELFGSDVYKDGRTKQAFKDSTDINKLLAKAARGESLSHLQRHGAVYGDFTDMPDLLAAQQRLARGQEIFAELPGEIRREFNQSPAAFFEYVNDPANIDKLPTLIPGLVKQGTQLVNVDRNAAPASVEPVVEPVVDPVVVPDPVVPPVVETPPVVT